MKTVTIAELKPIVIDEDKSYVATQSFQDQSDPKNFEKGDDVTHLPADRLQFLVANGLVKKGK